MRIYFLYLVGIGELKYGNAICFLLSNIVPQVFYFFNRRYLHGQIISKAGILAKNVGEQGSLRSLDNHKVLRYTLDMITLSRLHELKKQLDVHRPFPKEIIQNLDEWYKVELTYTSNAIEGNTLTRQETALVVEKGITVEGKSIVEHLEAINHAKSLGIYHDIAK